MEYSENDNILPVELKDFRPVELPDLGPIHKEAIPYFPSWKNWAHQRHVNDVTLSELHGDLWLATGGGVLRWYPEHDKFTRYTSEHGLPGNSITAITEDFQGNIYCAPSYGGLYFLNDDAWYSVGGTSHERLPIRCMARDRSGNIWLGALDGIYTLDNEEGIKREFLFPSVEPPRSIAVADNGDVWACYSLGLFRFSGSGVHQAGKQPTLLHLDCNGKKLWVGKMDGLVVIDLESKKPDQKTGWPLGTINAMMAYSRGVYLVCDNTLGRVADDIWEPLFPDIQGHCSKLTRDRWDGVWLAIHSGLDHWSETRPQTPPETKKSPDFIKPSNFDGPEKFFGNIIQCLDMERKGEETLIWAATQEGLFSYSEDGLELTDFKYHSVEGIRDIQALTAGPTPGDIWLSGFSGGVYNSQRGGNVEKMPGVTVPILSLHKGFNGARWAIGTDGLYVSRGKKWELALKDTALPAGSALMSLAQTKADQLWLGASSGLIRYSIDEDAIEVPKDYPFSCGILSLAYDHANEILWAGTESGLFGLRDFGDGWEIIEKFHYTVMNSGLASDRVISLGLDDFDPNAPKLWIGTPCGLSRLSYQL